MAQKEYREKDEKNLELKIKKGDAEVKLSGASKEEYHSKIRKGTTLQRHATSRDEDSETMLPKELQSDFSREVLRGAVLALVSELLSVL